MHANVTIRKSFAFACISGMNIIIHDINKRSNPIYEDGIINNLIASVCHFTSRAPLPRGCCDFIGISYLSPCI